MECPFAINYSYIILSDLILSYVYIFFFFIALSHLWYGNLYANH